MSNRGTPEVDVAESCANTKSKESSGRNSPLITGMRNNQMWVAAQNRITGPVTRWRL